MAKGVPHTYAGRRMKGVDLDKLTRQCRTVLGREVEKLMDSSHAGKLSKEDALALASYFKLISDLKKQEKEEGENLTDEQLEALVKKETK